MCGLTWIEAKPEYPKPISECLKSIYFFGEIKSIYLKIQVWIFGSDQYTQVDLAYEKGETRRNSTKSAPVQNSTDVNVLLLKSQSLDLPSLLMHCAFYQLVRKWILRLSG